MNFKPLAGDGDASMYRFVVPMLFLVIGCGGRQSALMQTSTAQAPSDSVKAETLASEAKALWSERGELKKANAAIEKWKEAAKADGTNPIYHRELTYAYYFLNNVHYRWTDDRPMVKKNYEAGVAAAETALALSNPAFAGQIKSGSDTDAVWKKALESATKEDVKALYWYATNLAKWALNNGITSLLKYKDRALLIIERCQTLDASFWYGGPARYLGAYWYKIPFGKDPVKSRTNFEAAVAVDPTYLDSKVLFADTYAVRAEDEALFKKLLTEVIEADAGANPDLIPENKNAQRIAKEMLENMDDIF